VDEIGRFVKEEGVLLQNPLDSESPESHLLIILDGLDELASQGKAAAETARAFVREVERTVDKRQIQRLRVLISGRELIIQENESEFRRLRQVLTLLPYFVPKTPEREQYHDPDNLLENDLRQVWWKTYGGLTGKGYSGLPKELSRSDLEEITAQPLLNYLVALSYSRGTLDFAKDVNLNSIYADLVTAVHERAYEKHRPYGPIRHMGASDFARVLEEIGLAAWHGDGRTTTVREIEEHCRLSGLGVLLDVFQEGAKAGVTRLLAAFFFRQHGQRASGDPTFIFTHKSFGEYLTARRVVRASERIVRELDNRRNDPDQGWDERDALKHWAQICGPSALTRYLCTFIRNEMNLRPISDLQRSQACHGRLFGNVLRSGMPMEQIQTGPFRLAQFQARNAEEALIVVLNACARRTARVSEIEMPDPTAFGAWFRRTQGQRSGPESALAADCLSFLDLHDAGLDMSDFYGCNFESSILSNIRGHDSCFERADLTNANLSGASLWKSNFDTANLEGANLATAQLIEANFRNANLERANLRRAQLVGADFGSPPYFPDDHPPGGANLKKAVLREADLTKADFRGADLAGADLTGAKLKGADFTGANLTSAKFDGAKLEGAKLDRTAVARIRSKGL
jgi:uncharacterized protein YjbI with pentapeptide repeats